MQLDLYSPARPDRTMNIIQLTPGAGAMFCGNCFRDNALVAVLRKMGHEVTMVPLYLPLTLDEADQSSGTPIFFSGINVYLEQKSAFFRQAPDWIRNVLASRPLLRWAAGRAACWQAVAERAAEVNAFIAPSRYFANLMSERLGLPAASVRVVYNGIDLAGYHGESSSASAHQSPPKLGFFARMCREKGLDTL